MRLSIRSRLTVWVTLLLVAASALTFLTVRAAGGLVLRGTLRDYLFGVVEENARRIVWAESPRDARGIRSLPGTLKEAVDCLKEDLVICAALGEHVLTQYVEGKEKEWDAYRTHVSKWETDRYLVMY